MKSLVLKILPNHYQVPFVQADNDLTTKEKKIDGRKIGVTTKITAEKNGEREREIEKKEMSRGPLGAYLKTAHSRDSLVAKHS